MKTSKLQWSIKTAKKTVIQLKNFPLITKKNQILLLPYRIINQNTMKEEIQKLPQKSLFLITLKNKSSLQFMKNLPPSQNKGKNLPKKMSILQEEQEKKIKNQSMKIKMVLLSKLLKFPLDPQPRILSLRKMKSLNPEKKR